jgi:hypothetical protein
VYVILGNVRYKILDYFVMRNAKIFQYKDVNIGENLGDGKTMGV